MVKLLALIVAIATALAGGYALRRDDPNNGRFHVDGTRIIDPSGNEFVPLGVNMLGPAAFFHERGTTVGHARILRTAWKVNTVRINMCLPEGCDYNDIRNDRNDDLDAIVDEYTSEGLVVMLALHQVKPGEWPDDEQLDRIDAFWHDTALRYAGNQRVWFNLLNEPGHEKPADPRWAAIHTRLLKTIRGVGADNIVVIDGTVWGQESGDTDAPRVAEEDSAILTFGRQVKGDDDAVVFSFHVYDGWGSDQLDDRGRDARLADYIDRVHGKDLALLIGETGGDVDPCCDPSSLATQSVFRVAPGKRIGILMWHGQAIDEHKLVYAGHKESDPGQIDDPRRPTNLTWSGRLFWDLTHG